MSDNILIGRKEIASYAQCSVWTVTAMIKAGLVCSGGKIKGKPPVTKTTDVDNFFRDNTDFTARSYYNLKGANN
jgi:hypothetical protein